MSKVGGIKGNVWIIFNFLFLQKLKKIKLDSLNLTARELNTIQ